MGKWFQLGLESRGNPKGKQSCEKKTNEPHGNANYATPSRIPVSLKTYTCI